MNQPEIDKLVDDMTSALRNEHHATGGDLRRTVSLFLMDAIRRTDDEWKSAAFEHANRTLDRNREPGS